METVRKAGALIFSQSRLLLVRPYDRAHFLNPGGKYEEGETTEQCLNRELGEEIGVRVVSYRHYRTYDLPASAFYDKDLRLEFYVVT